ncbi:MAG: ABC transporter substrate-binding protein [Pseudonocardiaceae bacterium]
MIKQVVRGMTGPTLLALVVAGCGAPPAEPSASSPPATSGAAQAKGFPVTVENCGRTLTFTKPPERVVTGYHPVFETMVDLGLGDRIIARLNFDENGPDGFLPGHKKVYDAIPEISTTIQLPQKEVLIAQQPDFVIDVSYSSFDAAKGLATIQELDSAGAPVYITAGWCDPEGVKQAKIADIFADIRNLGMIFGVPERAAALTAEFQGIIDDVTKRVKGRAPVDVLATDGGSGPVNAYGGSGLFHQMIEIAGGRNVLADLDEDYAEVSVEKIAASKPGAMLVVDYDVLLGEQQPSAPEKAKTVFTIIPDSPAAQQQRFLPVPAAATHSGAGNIRAIPGIAEFLHPEAFAR